MIKLLYGILAFGIASVASRLLCLSFILKKYCMVCMSDGLAPALHASVQIITISN